MISEIYVQELYENLSYLATWLPTTEMKLGDIGTMKGKEFVYLDHGANLGLGIKPDKGKSRRDDSFEYRTAGQVDLSIKLQGEASFPGAPLAKADTGFICEFDKENSILFKPKGIQVQRISNQIDLKNQIEELYFKKKKWERDWVIVTEVVKVQSATILISANKGAKVGLKANVEVPKLTEGDLANAELDLGFSAGQDQLSIKILAKDPLTPLFKIKKIKRSLFGIGGGFKGKELSKRDIDQADLMEAEGLSEVLLSDLT